MADASSSRPPPPTLGRCGRYDLLVELASGGMATVYLARASDAPDAPLVAIKRPHRHLAKDPGYLSMLVDEARLASAIQHDNVVKVRELGFDAGEPFIVMDYVEGASLADVRKRLASMGRALDPKVAVRIALDALAGLHAAHVLCDDQGKHLGIVHRDVSPHNVLVGCNGTVRLTDFGIAKAADRVQVTRTHEVKGKLAYLAPERIDKRRMCTVQSDVFSMAVVLWECIAGRRLFRGEEALETLQEVMTAPIPSLRRIGVNLSQELDDVILRGLARDLDDRYETASEFAAALERAAGSGGVARPYEIASLVEVLFGERLRLRHEDIRLALADEDVSHVLELSGLNERPAPTPDMREREERALEGIAPPAPSERYAFGASEKLDRLASPRVRRLALGALGAAVVVALAVVFLRRPAQAPEAPESAEAAEATLDPATRRVVVPLPFVATRVTLDDQARAIDPPADVVTFDVPLESGARHLVTALAADGSRAEAYVREEDGVARPEGGSFAVEALEAIEDDPSLSIREYPTPPGAKKGGRLKVRKVPPKHVATPPAASPAPAASAPKPVGTVKNGFTKLR